MPDHADPPGYDEVSVDEFRRWLRMGIGRAALYLREHDPEPYQDVVLDACMHNRVFDPQSEGTRGEYLVEVADAAGVLKQVRAHVLGTISTQSDSDWSLSQYVAIALALNERGDSQPLAQFWRRFLFSDLWFAAELVAHGDLGMFLRVADVVGMNILTQPTEYFDPKLLIELAAEKHGDDVVSAALEQAVVANHEVAAFIRASRAPEYERWSAIPYRYADIDGMSFSDLQPLFGTKDRFHGHNAGSLTHRGKLAPQAEIMAAATTLPLDLDSAYEVCRHLAIFRKRAFPGDPNLLIDIVRRASSLPGDWDAWPFPDGKRITIAAQTALENVRDPAVRQFALSLMGDPRLRRWSTRLLINNLDEGDYARIRDYIGGPLSDNEVHSTALDLPPMVTLHPSPEAVPVLLILYERSLCSECRRKIVGALIDLNALPAWMVRECCHDANVDTHSLVAAFRDPEL